uniref:Uncharacterized protein n=1 Tax=Setaria viridis TaxID=4556 RepID=A0A4U6V8G1_SETVI|nr:hypothetical protein SEVIR_3G048350v2 [Setaria viridis]
MADWFTLSLLFCAAFFLSSDVKECCKPWYFGRQKVHQASESRNVEELES